MPYDDTTSYYDDGSELAGALSNTDNTPIQPKYNKLQSKKQEKLDRLAGPDVVDTTLIGMTDADTVTIGNGLAASGEAIRLTGRNGYFDAVEGVHAGVKLNDSTGKYEEVFTGNPLESAASNKWKAGQLDYVASKLGKPVNELTKQDFIDVSEQQKIQMLSDLANGNNNWKAPLIRNASPINVTGKTVDEFGNRIDVPLGIDVTYRGSNKAPVSGDYKGQVGVGKYGRLLGELGSADGTNVTEMATINPEMNVSVPQSTDNAALIAELDKQIAELGRTENSDDGYGGELMDQAQGSLYSIWARFNKAAGDLTEDTMIGDVVKTYDELVNPSGIVGTADKVDELVDMNTAMKYAGTSQKTLDDYAVGMEEAESKFKEKDYVGAIVGGFKMLPQILAQSTGEMAPLMIPGGVVALASLRTKEYNDEYTKNNGKGMDTGKLAETFLGQVAVLGLEKFAIKSGITEVLKPKGKVLDKLVGIVKSSGEEGLQEYLEGVSEDWATQQEGKNSFGEILASDKNKFSGFLGAVMGAGTKGAGTVVTSAGTLANNTLDEKLTERKTKQEVEKEAANTPQPLNEEEMTQLDKEVEARYGESIKVAAGLDTRLDEDIEARKSGKESVLTEEEAGHVKNAFLARLVQLDQTLTNIAAEVKKPELTDQQKVALEQQRRQTLDDIDTATAIIGLYSAKVDGPVLNNRPIEDILSDIKKVEAEVASVDEITPELDTKRKSLEVEKLIVESNVLPDADEKGLDSGVTGKVTSGDLQTMKIYGGRDQYGNYFKGLMRYVDELVGDNKPVREAAKRGLQKFMTSQNKKLEAARVAKNEWKEGSGTVEKQYGVRPDGTAVTFKYHGPQSNNMIADMEAEVKLFQQVYDKVVNDKFDYKQQSNNSQTNNEITGKEKQEAKKYVEAVEQLDNIKAELDSAGVEYKVDTEITPQENITKLSKLVPSNKNEKGSKDEQRTEDVNNERPKGTEETRERSSEVESKNAENEESTGKKESKELVEAVMAVKGKSIEELDAEYDAEVDSSIAKKAMQLATEIGRLNLADKTVEAYNKEVLVDELLEVLYNKRKLDKVAEVLEAMIEHTEANEFRKLLNKVIKLDKVNKELAREIEELDSDMKAAEYAIPTILNLSWRTLQADITKYKEAYARKFEFGKPMGKSKRNKLTRELNKKYGIKVVQAGKEVKGLDTDTVTQLDSTKKKLTKAVDKINTVSNKQADTEFEKSEIEYELDKTKKMIKGISEVGSGIIAQSESMPNSALEYVGNILKTNMDSNKFSKEVTKLVKKYMECN